MNSYKPYHSKKPTFPPSVSSVTSVVKKEKRFTTEYAEFTEDCLFTNVYQLFKVILLMFGFNYRDNLLILICKNIKQFPGIKPTLLSSVSSVTSVVKN